MTPRRVTEAILSCSANLIFPSDIFCHSPGVIELEKEEEPVYTEGRGLILITGDIHLGPTYFDCTCTELGENPKPGILSFRAVQFSSMP